MRARARLIQRPSDVGAVLRHGWGFAKGVRGLVKQQITLEESVEAHQRATADRAEVLLDTLDQLIWSQPSSPYGPLLAHAGVDRAELRVLVRAHGIESSLERLRDAGVYVTYEEYLGHEPLRRGRLELELGPTSFANPSVQHDLFASTGGTRGGAGTPVTVSFAEKSATAGLQLLRQAAYGSAPLTPTAVWLPCLPSAAGLMNVLSLVATSEPPARWFSQIPTTMEDVSASKRLTNLGLPLIGRLSGMRIPRPEHAPNDEPEPVLRWCLDALHHAGAARLLTYPSSAVLLAEAALERDVRLDGLVVNLTGEPATIGRRRAVEASGATTAAWYAFMQAAGVGSTCPNETAERYHLHDEKVAVIGRRRERSDGAVVDALLWTSIQPATRVVMLNTENDDYGTIERDDEPCTCLWGEVGSRTRVRDVRGMSKVVAGGVTVAGDVLDRLVDEVLPAAFGGTPLNYQFAEIDSDDRGVLVLRVDPRLGPVDEDAVLDRVVAELERDEMGRLASAVWVPGRSIRVDRALALAAPSGKTLAFEPLVGATDAGG